MASEVPYVSIIIPHYNRSRIISSTINSMVSQTFINWEAIIVDDKSESSEYKALLYLVKDERIKIIINDTRLKGPSVCRNLGVKEARGKYLLFLDSDDLLVPFCLDQRVKALEEYPDLVMGVFLMHEFIINIGDCEKIYNKTNITSDQLVANFIRNKNPWNVTCPLWRSDFFKSIGGFDEELFYMEDPEIHLRALFEAPSKIKTFYQLPPDCYYRINYHDDTKIGFYENSIKYRILFYEKICGLVMHRGLLKIYKKDIWRGIKSLIKNFLINKLHLYNNYYLLILDLVNKYNLTTTLNVGRLKLLRKVWLSENSLIRIFKIRGITYYIFSLL